VWTVAASSSSAPSFADLTSAGQTRRLRRLALSALEAYEVSVCGLVRLHGWNTTFRVDGPNGERHVLRVQRTNGPTPTMVGSELAWLLALGRDTDLAVPQPIANRFGDPLTVAAAPGVPERRTCVLFRWVRGRFLDARLTETHLRRVGILTARLQQHGQTCPCWTASIGAGPTRSPNSATAEARACRRRSFPPPGILSMIFTRAVPKISSALDLTPTD
jgi:Ser/Thr protein kinase RdoA (MazF antagonist)